MKNALRDFQGSLNRVESLANSIFLATSVEENARLINETQQSAATVLLTGYFEAFLKEVMRAYVSELSKSGTAFGDLPATVRQRHFENGGRVLQDVTNRAAKNLSSKFGNVRPEDVVTRLYSPVASIDGNYSILWEAFADTQESPRSTVVSSLLQNLGLKDAWPAIEGAAKSSGLAESLNALIEVRNECAHTGRISNVPTPPEIIQYINTLRSIGSAIVEVLESALMAYRPAGATPLAQAVAGQ
jgi:RiboL-PSP-HEPN